MRRPVLCVLGLVMSVSLAACDNGPDPNAPTPPPAQTFTETFTGEVTVNGATTHSFTTSGAGVVTATITAIDPSESTVVSFSLGTWNGAVCQLSFTNDLAVQSSVLTGTTSTAANLCVRMASPVSSSTETVNYTVTVVHP